MPDVGTPSLDQLQVFLAVVETGSFAAAGRRLRRATSAVSYTIAQLERQLGIALFDRERTESQFSPRLAQSCCQKPAQCREGSMTSARA